MRFVLDEHVGRVFEHVLRERGHEVEQASDRFGDGTTDSALLDWCGRNGVVLVTNDAKDFEPLHRDTDHAGLFLYHDQNLPEDDPEGLARAVDEVVSQYGADGIENELVTLDDWYQWLHE
jgi:hypothetical protein